MTKCIHCNVKISDDTKICPLCQCVADQAPGATYHIGEYPDVWLKVRKLKHACNIILAAVLGASAILAICNFAFYSGSLWSLIPIGAMAYGYMVFQLMISRKGYRLKVLIPILLGFLLILLIDVLTGFYGWSLNFVMPAMILAVEIIIIMLMLTNLKNWQSYIIMQIGMTAVSLIPLILWGAGLVTIPLLSIIAFILSLLLFTILIIVGGKSARAELKRRFHII